MITQILSPALVVCDVGNIKCFGCLTLGQPLGLEGALRLEECGTSEALPALLALSLATWCVMDYSAHNYLLPKLRPCEKWMAKDGEGATEFQILTV